MKPFFTAEDFGIECDCPSDTLPEDCHCSLDKYEAAKQANAKLERELEPKIERLQKENKALKSAQSMSQLRRIEAQTEK